MIPFVTNESAEIVMDKSQRAAVVQFDVLDTVFLADLLQDTGDGYRPINPLIIGIGGSVVELPVRLDRGTHQVALLGDEFNGKAFLATGLQMSNIRDIYLLGAGDLGVASGAEVANEELVGSIDGVNQDFQTITAFAPGMTKVYLNTTRMVLGVDYVEVGNQGIRVNPAPQVGDMIRIDYSKA